MRFSTICKNPNTASDEYGALWAGPTIVADNWEQASLRALAIEHWLNNMGLYSDLHVDGEIVMEIDADTDEVLFDKDRPHA